MPVTTLCPAWREALRVLIEGGLGDGDVLHKSQLAKSFGLENPITARDQEVFQMAFMKQFCDFREELLSSHNMALKTMYGESSYQVVPAKEQTEFAICNGKVEIIKATRRMARTLLFVRHDLLTSDEKKQNADALARTAMLTGMVKTSRVLSLAR